MEPVEKAKPVYSFTEKNAASILDDMGLILSAGELEEAYEAIRSAFEERGHEVAEDALVDYRESLQRRWEWEHRRIA